MRVLAVYNIKGGVGKTTTAVNLAYLSSEAGLRTLLWDLDPQGSSSFYFRVRGDENGSLRKLVRGKRPLEELLRGTDYEGLDLLPSSFSYRHLDLALQDAGKPVRRLERLISPLGARYDHVYLDCAPSISLVSEGVFGVADTLLVPTIPTTLSLRTLDQLERHLDENGLRVRVRPFFCMADRRKGLHREIIDSRGRSPSRFLDTTIPYSSTVERMGIHRAPLAVYAPGSEADAAYRELWKEALASSGSWLGWGANGFLGRLLRR